MEPGDCLGSLPFATALVNGVYYYADYLNAGPLLERLHRETRYDLGAGRRRAWIIQ